MTQTRCATTPNPQCAANKAVSEQDWRPTGWDRSVVAVDLGDTVRPGLNAEALFATMCASADDDESHGFPVVEVVETVGIDGSDVAEKHFFWVWLRVKGEGFYLDADDARYVAMQLLAGADEAEQRGGDMTVDLTKKIVRCGRCKKRLRNGDGWNVTMRQGVVIGFTCPACQTPEENAEAEINEATEDYGRDQDGYVISWPKIGRR